MQTGALRKTKYTLNKREYTEEKYDINNLYSLKK